MPKLTARPARTIARTPRVAPPLTADQALRAYISAQKRELRYVDSLGDHPTQIQIDTAWSLVEETNAAAAASRAASGVAS